MSDLHYFRPDWIQPSTERLSTDLCIYGATSAGLIAAVEATRRNKKVVIVHPGKFVGGLTAGGLGWTDHGQKKVIGGLSRDFYRQVGKLYGKEDEFLFPPSAATRVYEDLMREFGITVHFGQFLDKVEMTGGKITEISLLGGLRVTAKVFIDATYEGDLIAGAKVSFTVGRESNGTYNETINGIYVGTTHQFSHRVDPFVKEGDPSSGLLPGILNEDLSKKAGLGDQRVQAYNFRMCMTDDPALRIPWQKPAGYDPNMYLLAGRWLRGEKDKYNEIVGASTSDGPAVPCKVDRFPNKTPGGHYKTDTNNHGAVSSDFIGYNHEWPQGCYEAREKIFQAHVTYQRGLYWYFANGEDVPQKYRDAWGRWGLPNDEFTQTEHWPCQLYVREARRMVSDHVITAADCTGQRVSPDPVGMGSYNMDSHNCSRFAQQRADGWWTLNEGDVQLPAKPYGISYKCIVPKRGEASNLLVPICLSSSHIAYGSARMEPVFMALGQSAATAACHAIDDNVSVQDVNYAKLNKDLLDAGQVLSV